MDPITVVPATASGYAPAAGAVPHQLAILIWAPLALLLAAGFAWLAYAAWRERRAARAAKTVKARAVPATLDLPLDFGSAAVQPAPLRRVQTAPRRLPAAWLDLDLDFGPPAPARRARPL